MRAQVRAAMIYNGHTPDTVDLIDEETFTEICVLFHDGIVGGRGLYDAITPLTTAAFNYMRKEGSPAYKPSQIFPWVVEYDENPDHEYEKAQAAMQSYFTHAPAFIKERLQNGGST